MVILSVNINKIALIRNSREGNNPDLVSYARNCIDLGAQGITVHPRPDQRHIRADDIAPLARLCAEFPGVEYNIEGNPNAKALGSYPGFLELVRQVKPDQVTLVPDSDDQLTSDHGFDLSGDNADLEKQIAFCQALGCRVSLFMDADQEQIKRVPSTGADRIEFYTGPFADAWNRSEQEAKKQFDHYAKCAELAHSLGLGINAGHDLNLDNMGLFKSLPELNEVSIGHALTIESLELGLATTLNRYRSLLANA
jgi:pyridoxine 5-phosphate synthase